MNKTWIGAAKSNYAVGRFNRKPTQIILHWMAIGSITDEQAMLAACGVAFNNPKRGASAHFGIAGTEVHQYVNEEDTAWHASNILTNRSSIGIEHAGGPSLQLSDQTYETSAELIAHLSRTWDIPLDKEHIKLHREVFLARTACPGNLDRDRIIARAKEIKESWNAPQYQPEPTPVPPAQDEVFNVTVTAPNGANFRLEPNTFSRIMRTYAKGKGPIACKAVVTGQMVLGSNVWYQTKLNGFYVHSTLVKRN